MHIEFLAVACVVVASMLGVVVVRRRVALETLAEHHEVAGICFAVVGGLYGIILAFVLVSSWQRYESAREQTEVEANAAGDLYRHAAAFSEPTRSRLAQAVAAYVQSTVDDEWPAMARNQMSQVTQGRYFEVWQAVVEARPADAREVALYQSTIAKLDDFADGRRQRIFYMRSGLPTVIWAFLIAFGVATVSFTYLFGMPRLAPQLAITAVLAATIASTLVLVRETQAPFSGGLRVDARAFRIALHFMGRDATPETVDD